jgi:hypothetical protein
VAFDVTDLDAGYARSVARGARPVMPPGPSPEPGVRMAFVADPEGNLIELLHRPPQTAPPAGRPAARTPARRSGPRRSA